MYCEHCGREHRNPKLASCQFCYEFITNPITDAETGAAVVHKEHQKARYAMAGLSYKENP